MKERCIVIPAIKKNAVIPDQLIKKLAGITLMERALNTARACAPGEDVIVLTDSEEIGLICDRAHVRHVRDSALRFRTWDIIAEMREFLEGLALEYDNCVILRASCPLLTWVDVENAWRHFRQARVDCLITVKNVRQRLWRASRHDADCLLSDVASEDEKNYVVETRAMVLLSLDFFRQKLRRKLTTIPFFLNDRGLEILDYQDWWICERLLERRHVVFVVAGYPAIGMGHVYRALMLAHEINVHKITFVCTRESALAVASIAARDYPVIRQENGALAETVLAQQPDLVVNDILNTQVPYMRSLRTHCRCVNFEDEGPGADLANLVINALYEGRRPHFCYGPSYFCLRDEFASAPRNKLRPSVRTLLISFGGTDQRNATLRVLNLVQSICLAYDIAIRIVAGPGYAHKAELEACLRQLDNPLISFTWATNIMSRMMEGADLAICSAGRTVYELAHMRVPAIVLATHEREAEHTFARPRNGFVFAGLMDKVSDGRIRNLFLAMLKQKRRAWYWRKQNTLDFSGNKERVVGLMLDQLEKTEEK